MNYAERFWARVKTGDFSQCWEWQGPRYVRGYGRVTGRRSDKDIKAHRVAYALIHGAIPDGLCIRHKCDNPPCCNPQHLEIGTHKQNMEDRRDRNRGHKPKGELNGRAKVTAQQVAYIKAQRGLKLQREIAAELGITQAQVSHIQIGRVWNP